MTKYTDGQTVVEAVQFNPRTYWSSDVIRWTDEYRPKDKSWGYLDTSIGPNHVRSGDWIITFANGEKTVCENNVFVRLYKPAGKKVTP